MLAGMICLHKTQRTNGCAGRQEPQSWRTGRNDARTTPRVDEQPDQSNIWYSGFNSYLYDMKRPICLYCRRNKDNAHHTFFFVQYILALMTFKRNIDSEFKNLIF